MKREVVLLMTATIAPKGCPGAMFTPEERERQYLKSFGFYLKHLSAKEGVGYSRLVFCDNSGHDLKRFMQSIPDDVASQVEIVSMPPDRFLPARGKGYNEELLIDNAISESKLLSNGDPFVFKVTGRYSILNICKLIADYRSLERDVDLYIDIKDHRLYSSLGLNWPQTSADTRCFGFALDFYRNNVLGRYDELDDSKGLVIERQVFDLYGRMKHERNMVFRFRRDLLIDGVPGHRTSFMKIPIPARFSRQANILKYCIRMVVRNIAPGFWF